MFSFAFSPPRFFAERRGWLPALALPLAMFAALLALGGDRAYFYRVYGIHNQATAKTMAIAENLSPEHGFRLARRVWRDDGGDFVYSLYSRFPIGGFALAKLAATPFDGLADKLLAARVLALAMFCGAASFAYLSIARISGSRNVAFAATALGFSGFYPIYYADAVFNEGVMDLFGAAMVFHGMTVFVQEGRFRQLLVKTCAALLLGWHVYALLLPFIALGLGGDALSLARSAVRTGGGLRARAELLAVGSLVRSRYAALAAVSVGFGAALLAANFAQEFAAYGAERALSEQSAFGSMTRRLGIAEDAGIDWGGFAQRQLYRVGAVAAPYAVVRAIGGDFAMPEPFEPPVALIVFGAAAALAALGALAFVRRRHWTLAASAVLFGFCWAVALRYNTDYFRHAHESLPYMGLALALFALALAGARGLLGARIGERAALALGAVALAAFSLSVFQEGRAERYPGQTELNKAIMADFTAIRKITTGKRVAVASDIWQWNTNVRPMHGVEYWLSGSYFKGSGDESRRGAADFTISRYRDESFDLLTPDNRFAFLYGRTEPAELYRAARRRLEASEPAARSTFDVYLDGESLRYLKSPCAPSDLARPFFLRLYAANPDDPFAFEGMTLNFVTGMEIFDGACLLAADLPGYPTAAVQTGQYVSGGETLWDVSIAPPLDAETLALYEDKYRAAASGEPAARAEFDLYMDGDRRLTYLKEPCGADDARGRFYLSVHPVDIADLPADRRELGHESLNFTFEPPAGMIFGGKCMASRELPDYAIERIETGQWVPGGERVWDAAVSFGD